MQAIEKLSADNGLEGVIAAVTRLSRVDGQRGELILAGYPVENLAPSVGFEEMVFLLWHDRLPETEEAVRWKRGFTRRRRLDPATLSLLRAAAGEGLSAMDALRMAASTLSLSAPSEPEQEAVALVAAFPTMVAAYARMVQEQEPVPPNPELGHAANFLFMLEGREPAPERVRALETYLNTVVDHGLNASTFAARVITSTRSDMISAITGALGALKGPLHGGAPGPALDMVFEIGEAANAEPYLRAQLARGARLMGFGHRVYRVRDPRADVLAEAADRLYASGIADPELYALAREVELTALKLLAEAKPGRRLETNVEFYTALLLHGLGLGTDLFTPTFAIGRVAGWAAHCLEQRRVGRLIRPKAHYEGPTNRRLQR